MKRSFQGKCLGELVSDDEISQVFDEACSKPLVSDHSLTSYLKEVRPPASDLDVEKLLAACGPLPASYLEFVRQSDGASGCVNDFDGDFLTLWSCATVAEVSVNLQTAHSSFPAILIVGTDGRGGWVGLLRDASLNAEEWKVIRVAAASASQVRSWDLAPRFSDWRREGFPLRPGGFVCCGG